jgi:hypothetical protein
MINTKCHKLKNPVSPDSIRLLFNSGSFEVSAKALLQFIGKDKMPIVTNSDSNMARDLIFNRVKGLFIIPYKNTRVLCQAGSNSLGECLTVRFEPIKIHTGTHNVDTLSGTEFQLVINTVTKICRLSGIILDMKQAVLSMMHLKLDIQLQHAFELYERAVPYFRSMTKCENARVFREKNFTGFYAGSEKNYIAIYDKAGHARRQKYWNDLIPQNLMRIEVKLNSHEIIKRADKLHPLLMLDDLFKYYHRLPLLFMQTFRRLISKCTPASEPVHNITDIISLHDEIMKNQKSGTARELFVLLGMEQVVSEMGLSGLGQIIARSTTSSSDTTQPFLDKLDKYSFSLKKKVSANSLYHEIRGKVLGAIKDFYSLLNLRVDKKGHWFDLLML